MDEAEWPMRIPWTYRTRENPRRVQSFIHERRSMADRWHIVGAEEGWLGWYESGVART